MKRTLKLFGALLALLLITAACGATTGDPEDTGAATDEVLPDVTEAEAPLTEGEATDAEESATDGAAASDIRTAMVTDVGGLGDQSFNDSAYAGLERAEDELGVSIEVLESSAPTDYVSNLTQLAESGFSPIFAVGFLMTDAVNEVAPQFPDTDFALIDSVADAENVANLVFQEHQGSYLAGIVAGLMTQQDTEYTSPDDQVVGFIGGQESDLIIKFEAGYVAGVESVCPECEVLVQYAGSTPDAFNDPARGNEIALQMAQQGADVIYHAAGATGAGLFEAAAEQSFFAIGVDSDQAQLVPDAPILTSMLKRVDNAVFQAVEGAVNDDYPAGEVVAYGLEDQGVALAEFGEFADVVPPEVTTAVDDARQAIIAGEVEVPEARQ